MIVDSHAHTVFPEGVQGYMADLVASRANPTAGPRKPITDEALHAATSGHVANMTRVGTDVQFISPRPFAQMHSLRPAKVTQLWTRFNNDLIHRQCAMFPDRLKGVAGLPQFRDSSPANCVEELERCVTELGFVGCLLNPDPMEGEGEPPPGLGDEFWYPLYEKLVALDVPALIHSAGSASPRESYTLKFINEESIAVVSLLESRVFEDFPTLKIVVSHGGGAIPYQIGRFRSWAIRRKQADSFDDRLRKLYFDTCLYSQDALELLFRTVGVDNCLFGTERPGTGSAFNPDWNHDFDDLKPVIEGIGFLSAEDRHKIFEGNARHVYAKAFAR
ncbi:MAG TPA: amidohydrolase family protein [Azospirillum sp.]|nr:amidohydrolase family protein [Azospirillum sp.]